MRNTDLLERRRHAEVTAPGQPLGTVLKAPLQPSSTFIELTDQDQQLVSCGIDMGTEGANIAIESLDRSEFSGRFHGTSLWMKETFIITSITVKNNYKTVT